MKTTLFSLLALLLPVILAAQPGNLPDTLNQYDEQGKKHGYWIVRNDEDIKVYEGRFEHGDPVGTLIRYFGNGNKKAEMHHLPDGRNVRVIFYYPDGKLAGKGKYLDQKKDSTWLYYSYYEGHLSMKEHYASGQKQGSTKKFYPDRSISEITFWKDGQRHGPWKQYYENGRLKLVARFEEGRLEGTFEIFNNEGEPAASGSYLHNKMHGTWKYYDQEGKEDFQVIYEHGKPANPAVLEKRAEEYFKMMDENLGKIPEPGESLFDPDR